ncbi:transporter substrate-binding domain-containing protein (plasmid) [Agrobacterium sp. rho-13.3]|uniref:transporter substrate-binding domain-containing protein n=1 Tax=Agrobacterium sp. rho-13.3 TaxID=3072980 RepID=UPI002A135EBF|nr:transporter substrate-binding domain-containing protein [Agrobacterium sp. rho-13.3]MDX8312042.1 transporter substrate-binding domain-containing protein [Agrobacterium sp. rho-13.3]
MNTRTNSARRLKPVANTTLLSLFTAALIFASLPGFAQARDLETAKKAGKIIIGISGDNPPYGFMDTAGKQQGFDAEIATAFAKSLGVELQFAQLSLAARIPSLASQKVDMLIASLGMTPERAQSVQFSAPYLEVRNYIISEKTATVTKPDDLKALIVGTPRSSTIDTLLTAMAPTGTDIRRFDDDSATIQSLLSGQVNAIAANQFAIGKLDGLKPGTYEGKLVIGNIWFAAASRPGEKDWNQAFNDFITKYRQTDEFKQSYAKWIKVDVPKFPESVENVPFVVK